MMEVFFAGDYRSPRIGFRDNCDIQLRLGQFDRIPFARGSEWGPLFHQQHKFNAGRVFFSDDRYFNQCRRSVTNLTDVISLPIKANLILAGGGTNNVTRLSDAFGEAYTPTTPGNWSPVPTTVQGALDELAADLLAGHRSERISKPAMPATSQSPRRIRFGLSKSNSPDRPELRT